MNIEKTNANCQHSYELRTIGASGDVSEVVKFIQDEFIVSRQTAKKMLMPGTLLVYHLSRFEAEEHIVRYRANGLICEYVRMDCNED